VLAATAADTGCCCYSMRISSQQHQPAAAASSSSSNRSSSSYSQQKLVAAGCCMLLAAAGCWLLLAAAACMGSKLHDSMHTSINTTSSVCYVGMYYCSSMYSTRTQHVTRGTGITKIANILYTRFGHKPGTLEFPRPPSRRN
jgi:hypothetical protein